MIKNLESTVSCCLLFACFVIGFAIGSDTAFAQTKCVGEIEEWTGILQELRAAMERAEILGSQSVIEAVREKVTASGGTETIAQTVRGVMKQKKALLEAAQSTCLHLADQEKLAYKNLGKCVSAGTAKKDNALTANFNALSKERDLILTSIKSVLADPAFTQYQNQQPPSPNDYRQTQYSYYQTPNRGQCGGYAPQSSYFYGRGESFNR